MGRDNGSAAFQAHVKYMLDSMPTYDGGSDQARGAAFSANKSTSGKVSEAALKWQDKGQDVFERALEFSTEFAQFEGRLGMSEEEYINTSMVRFDARQN